MGLALQGLLALSLGLVWGFIGMAMFMGALFGTLASSRLGVVIVPPLGITGLVFWWWTTRRRTELIVFTGVVAVLIFLFFSFIGLFALCGGGSCS